MLYVCGTPIGNLEDISLRVLRLLKEADVIAAEDTRHTRKLLSHFGISTPLTSYHEHNKTQKADEILKLLNRGKAVALVTDAGMPGISDPGEELIRLCAENGITAVAAPGPTAAVTALVMSGFSASRFIFEGFLPRNKKSRTEILNLYTQEERTAVFYEAPHHLRKTLGDMYEVLGSRQISLARELTKKHEEILRGSISYFTEYFQTTEPRGEYVLVLEGVKGLKRAHTLEWQSLDIHGHMDIYLKEGLDKKSAMKAVARDRGVSKSQVYRLLIGETAGD